MIFVILVQENAPNIAEDPPELPVFSDCVSDFKDVLGEITNFVRKDELFEGDGDLESSVEVGKRTTHMENDACCV